MFLENIVNDIVKKVDEIKVMNNQEIVELLNMIKYDIDNIYNRPLEFTDLIENITREIFTDEDIEKLLITPMAAYIILSQSFDIYGMDSKVLKDAIGKTIDNNRKYNKDNLYEYISLKVFMYAFYNGKVLIQLNDDVLKDGNIKSLTRMLKIMRIEHTIINKNNPIYDSRFNVYFVNTSDILFKGKFLNELYPSFDAVDLFITYEDKAIMEKDDLIDINLFSNSVSIIQIRRSMLSKSTDTLDIDKELQLQLLKDAHDYYNIGDNLKLNIKEEDFIKFIQMSAMDLKKTSGNVGNLSKIYNDLKRSQIPEKAYKKLEKIYNFESHVDILNLITEQYDQEDVYNAFILPMAVVYALIEYIYNMSLYPVQIISFLYGLNSFLEVNTGEGKSIIIIAIAMYKNMLNKSTTILTQNEYLAQRDYERFSRLSDFINIKSASISNKDVEVKTHLINIHEYDVIYTTSNALVFYFQYLFKTMQLDLFYKFRKDVLLLDESDMFIFDNYRDGFLVGVEPINKINYPTMTDSLYMEIYKISNNLTYQEIDTEDISDMDKLYYSTTNDIYVDNKKGVFILTQKGNGKLNNHTKKIVQKLKDDKFLFYDKGNYDKLVDLKLNEFITSEFNNALHAKYGLKENVDYILIDNRVVLISNITGRQLPSRIFTGSTQAYIFIKHNLMKNLEEYPNSRKLYQDRNTVTHFYEFLSLFDNTIGLSGTNNEIEDFINIFTQKELVRIPPHKKSQRKDNQTIYFKELDDSYDYILDLIREIHAQEVKNPILISTPSLIEAKLVLKEIDEKLNKKNVQLLSPFHEDKEELIISKAGLEGAITVDTGLANRGTDIKLGGGNKAQQKRIEDAGGLIVIIANRVYDKRVERQIKGRSGRQSQKGMTYYLTTFNDRAFDTRHIQRIIKKTEIDNINNVFKGKSLVGEGALIISYLVDSFKEDSVELEFEYAKALSRYNDYAFELIYEKTIELWDNVFKYVYNPRMYKTREAVYSIHDYIIDFYKESMEDGLFLLSRIYDNKDKNYQRNIDKYLQENMDSLSVLFSSFNSIISSIENNKDMLIKRFNIQENIHNASLETIDTIKDNFIEDVDVLTIADIYFEIHDVYDYYFKDKSLYEIVDLLYSTKLYHNNLPILLIILNNEYQLFVKGILKKYSSSPPYFLEDDENFKQFKKDLNSIDTLLKLYLFFLYNNIKFKT